MGEAQVWHTAKLSAVLEEEWSLFAASRRRKRRSEETIKIYRREFVKFWWWAVPSGVANPEAVTRRVIHLWIDWMQHEDRGWADNYVHLKFRHVRAFFGWWARETQNVNPFAGVDAPPEEVKAVPVVPIEDVQALIKTCKGSKQKSLTFFDLRDEALIRIFYDTGVRLGEMENMEVGDWDRRHNKVTVSGKTGERVIPLSANTVDALGRYMRARSRLDLDHDKMWVARGGKPLTGSGIEQILNRRCKRAGSTHIYPHRLRHTMAHEFRLQGGQLDDLIYLGGWADEKMPLLYGASAADERAQVAHRRVALGDRL